MNLESQVRRIPLQVASVIADVLADAGADLVATPPDGWIPPLIKHLAQDDRFRQIAVNREESAVSLCSGASFSGLVGVAQPTTAVLELDPPSRHYEPPPFDGPELKYRFGRALERRFDHKVLP